MDRIKCRFCEYIQAAGQFCRRCGRQLPYQPPQQVIVERIVERIVRVPAIDLTLTFAEIERHMILERVEHFEGNIIAAARSLGISRNAMYRKVRRYRCANNGDQNGHENS
ncbi:hypothetical protein DYQ86_16200 [Acidobacteria bacterium AB60]|nr:hypothetical protein DYQ86_16200 [Acidobacteria bacterium AB60]